VDVARLTALLNQVAGLPMSRFTDGPLNVKLHPSIIRAAGEWSSWRRPSRPASRPWGMNVMVNVFTQMGRRAQDELITRTEEQA
jgi:hypothetical protein